MSSYQDQITFNETSAGRPRKAGDFWMRIWCYLINVGLVWGGGCGPAVENV